jgi:23S rRNA-/tRNA-specific pseudouridylate synthase
MRLHAYKIAFVHPLTNQVVEYTAPEDHLE